jgi:O-antigen/teichoic acid export membrane protein
MKYWGGMGIIPIILTAYYFNGMYINLAAGCYIEKKTKYLPAAIGVAGISNIALNFILIPFMGFWGAAWATLGAYAISALILYYYIRKIYPIKYEWPRLLKIYAYTAIAYFAGMTLTSGMNPGESFLIRLAFVGVFFLLLVLSAFFTRDEISRIRSIASLKRI